jgi:hypothetical protein
MAALTMVLAGCIDDLPDPPAATSSSQSGGCPLVGSAAPVDAACIEAGAGGGCVTSAQSCFTQDCSCGSCGPACPASPLCPEGVPAGSHCPAVTPAASLEDACECRCVDCVLACDDVGYVASYRGSETAGITILELELREQDLPPEGSLKLHVRARGDLDMGFRVVFPSASSFTPFGAAVGPIPTTFVDRTIAFSAAIWRSGDPKPVSVRLSAQTLVGEIDCIIPYVVSPDG